MTEESKKEYVEKFQKEWDAENEKYSEENYVYHCEETMFVFMLCKYILAML